MYEGNQFHIEVCLCLYFLTATPFIGNGGVDVFRMILFPGFLSLVYVTLTPPLRCEGNDTEPV